MQSSFWLETWPWLCGNSWKEVVISIWFCLDGQIEDSDSISLWSTENGIGWQAISSFVSLLSGPGTGKSRLLDEFPSVLTSAVSGCGELEEMIAQAYVFKLSFENGTQNNPLPFNPDFALGARMLYQLQNKYHWGAFKTFQNIGKRQVRSFGCWLDLSPNKFQRCA